MSIVGIKPCRDEVLIRPLKREEKEGSLFVPGSSKLLLDRGQIVAMGPGRRNDFGTLLPMGLRVGDLAMYSAHSGIRLVFEKIEYLMLREGEILGVFEEGLSQKG